MPPFTLLYPAGGVLVSHIILALLLVKASSSIFVTLFGMVTELHQEKVLLVDYQYYTL